MVKTLIYYNSSYFWIFWFRFN